MQNPRPRNGQILEDIQKGFRILRNGRNERRKEQRPAARGQIYKTVSSAKDDIE